METMNTLPEAPGANRASQRTHRPARTHLLFRHPQAFRWIMNAWPPYWGTGIWVAEVAPDFRSMKVVMKKHAYNANAFGTHFGGSLYAMCDPHYALLLVALLGDEYVVWDRAARIEFLSPGRSTVSATFTWSDEQLEDIRRHTQGGAKYEPERVVEVIDEAGEVVARVHKTLYVRRRAA
jgi:acyl-coenzyme A thioesterase PaaI-like protein